MRAMVWILAWVALVALSVAYLWPRVRQLLRRAGLLARELARVQERKTQTPPGAGLPDGRIDSPDQLAVFARPRQVLAERERTRRTLRGLRLARREANLPTWARRVDSRRH